MNKRIHSYMPPHPGYVASPVGVNGLWDTLSDGFSNMFAGMGTSLSRTTGAAASNQGFWGTFGQALGNLGGVAAQLGLSKLINGGQGIPQMQGGYYTTGANGQSIYIPIPQAEKASTMPPWLVPVLIGGGVLALVLVVSSARSKK